MSVSLVLRQIFKQPLFLGNREVKIIGLAINTSPALLLDEGWYEGWRPANRGELEEFARKYRPAKWFELHAIDPQIIGSPFGPIAAVYATKGGSTVEQVGQNPIWGLPEETLVLFVPREGNQT